MKERKHQTSDYEMTLERLEAAIENIDPDTTVSLDDVFRMAGIMNTNRAVRAATTMLLLKYGIAIQKG